MILLTNAVTTSVFIRSCYSETLVFLSEWINFSLKNSNNLDILPEILSIKFKSLKMCINIEKKKNMLELIVKFILMKVLDFHYFINNFYWGNLWRDY